MAARISINPEGGYEADLLNVNTFYRRSVYRKFFSHGFAHVDGPDDIVATFLDDVVLFSGDLFDLSIYCFGDGIEKSFITNCSFGVR